MVVKRRRPAWQRAVLGPPGQEVDQSLVACSDGISVVGMDEPLVEEIVDDRTVWRIDRSFLASTWTCIWGRGCLGIGEEPAPAAGLGCCSIGAELDGPDEARLISALAATLDPGRFEHHHGAATEGVFSNDTRTATQVVDGACIFLNRPGFPGGAGCALHLAALEAGESPVNWKPSV